MLKFQYYLPEIRADFAFEKKMYLFYFQESKNRIIYNNINGIKYNYIGINSVVYVCHHIYSIKSFSNNNQDKIFNDVTH